MISFEDRLDPQVAAAVRQMPPVLDSASGLMGIRKTLEAFDASMADQLPPPNPLVAQQDRHVPGPVGAPDVLVRVYQPLERPKAPMSAFLWIHAGGFFVGNYKGDNVFCEEIVLATGALVVSVEYRLAPEHPFPAAPNDCYAALQWLASASQELYIDASRIVVGGASAGGGLAAAVALMARDKGGPALYYQFLLIPVMDDRPPSPSCQEITDPRTWNWDLGKMAWEAYLAGSDGEISSWAAPARAADLSGLPPAYMHVDEQDLLRDEGIAYATRLMQSGVRTELHVFPGTFHAAFAFAPMADVCQRAHAEHMTTLKRVLNNA